MGGGRLSDEIKSNKRNTILYFMITFILIFTLSFLVLFYLEIGETKIRESELKKQEQRVLDLEGNFLSHEFNTALSDISYLHHIFGEKLIEGEDYNEIKENWVDFSTHRNVYDQIRYIDENGMEKLRINLGTNGGYIVSSDKLQNKGDRYYFLNSMKLSENEIYVSPIDLNIEDGKIEVPYKPVIRIARPIYDANGKNRGIIILNFLAEYMISGFREIAHNSSGEVILLNQDSYSLSSQDPSNDWNFMFDDKKDIKFSVNNPSEWEMIVKGNDQFVTKKGLFTSKIVILSDKFKANIYHTESSNIQFEGGNWYMVSFYPRSKANLDYYSDNYWEIASKVISKNAFYFMLIVIISLIVTFFIYLNRRAYSKIKYYSEIDPLTKSYNRRAGIEKINGLLPFDEKRYFVVSLCFIDINGLKSVNDTLGHTSGDELIVSVVKIIKETIREQDFIIRLGGDEFLIVFNGIGTELAEKIWERILAGYEKINSEESRPYVISVSHGIVDYDNMKKTKVDDLINEADEKMYSEKEEIKRTLVVIK